MQIQEIVVRMTGSGGFQNIDVPSHFMDEYQFVTLINLTDNHMLLFPKGVTVRIPGNEIVALAQYSSITLPISPDMKLGLVATWINVLGTRPTEIKLGKVIFSIENLNQNASYSPSFTSRGENINVSITPATSNRFFGGILTNAVLFTATRNVTINSFYLCNTLTTAATITISHRRPTLADVALVSVLSIAGNMTYSLGFIALQTGDSIVASAVTGTIHGSIYGVM